MKLITIKGKVIEDYRISRLNPRMVKLRYPKHLIKEYKKSEETAVYKWLVGLLGNRWTDLEENATQYSSPSIATTALQIAGYSHHRAELVEVRMRKS